MCIFTVHLPPSLESKFSRSSRFDDIKVSAGVGDYNINSSSVSSDKVVLRKEKKAVHLSKRIKQHERGIFLKEEGMDHSAGHRTKKIKSPRSASPSHVSSLHMYCVIALVRHSHNLVFIATQGVYQEQIAS
jgi:hypothetical protein